MLPGLSHSPPLRSFRRCATGYRTSSPRTDVVRTPLTFFGIMPYLFVFTQYRTQNRFALLLEFL
ncbi:hypothetical protein EHI48_32545 [Rhizobium sp. WSM1325]|nr:hypothetical protein EHI48_32545 [Rhizobium leguminosarum]